MPFIIQFFAIDGMYRCLTSQRLCQNPLVRRDIKSGTLMCSTNDDLLKPLGINIFHPEDTASNTTYIHTLSGGNKDENSITD